MLINELTVLAAWMGTLFAIVGIIAMLIINVKTQYFIIDKLVEFGNASKYLTFPDSKIISDKGKIKALLPQKIKFAKGYIIPTNELKATKLHGSVDWKPSSITSGKKKFFR